MELFKKIRLNFGTSILKKRITRTKRKVFYSNISLVKNIGIVWDASRTEEFASITKFYQKMHERNIDVKILGYFQGKDLPNQYTAIRYLTIIRKQELNFFYIPVSNESNTFINNRFDILIDINFNKVFTLYYISAQSKAAFKVGLFDAQQNESPFDLMMEIKNPVNVDDYLNHIIKYLEMINSGTVKQSIIK